MRTKTPNPTDGRETEEVILNGLGVAAGIAIGPAHVVETGFAQVPEYVLTPDALEEEKLRFAEAVAKARRQLRKLKAKSATLPDAAAEEISYLLDAHLAIVGGSRLLRGVEQRITEERLNAEWAVQAEMTAIAQHFAAMDDPYLAARIQDIRDVGARLIRNLVDRKFQAYSTLPSDSVILAEEITPADTALMDPRRIAGFATTLGGAEGHTAIMARSLGLPAVLGVSELLRRVHSGQTVIVDGNAGLVIVEPSQETLARYQDRRAEMVAEQQQLRTLIALPSRTRDGVAVALAANVELPHEIAAAVDVGADGIGLLRTEFQFMNREDLPTEQEQYETLRDVVEGMNGRPVTLRTLDIGGEKLASALGPRFTPGNNPALGLRAIRLSLREPKLLETQFAAMLRAGAHGPVRILLPMVANIEEVRRSREILQRAGRRLARRRVPMAPDLPPFGVMIEIPGTALAADAFARECDFFALGTNDLIQYTLAIDRGDEQVAHLYEPLHPAVLRLIQFTTQAAMRARIPLSVCGEMAGDARYTALLIGLGIRELSMTPAALLRVKNRVRMLDALSARHRADVIMDQSDSGRIASLIDDFNDAL
ncbi:MAG: phosphoenolpyruvate--protein phosphotransferase [Rhodospirillaceae bacterium]|nr:phosphoenolpyruvate--protein phosphotransferase [Rhodospirillaceae bacterium]